MAPCEEACGARENAHCYANMRAWVATRVRRDLGIQRQGRSHICRESPCAACNPTRKLNTLTHAPPRHARTHNITRAPARISN
jgi:hypothetical protein